MIDLRDNNGNRIVSKHKKWLYHLYLYLRWKRYPRAIWTLDLENKVWTVKRDPSKHTFNKSDSYWFNRELVHKLEDDWRVVVKQPKTKLVRTCLIKDIKESDSHLYFMSQGFELQMFMPKSKMEIDILK